MFRFVNRNEEILKIKKTKIELVKALLVHCNIFFSHLFLSSHRNYFIRLTRNEWMAHTHTHTRTQIPIHTHLSQMIMCVCVEWRVWVVHTFVYDVTFTATIEQTMKCWNVNKKTIKIWYFSFIWFSRSIDCRYTITLSCNDHEMARLKLVTEFVYITNTFHNN